MSSLKVLCIGKIVSNGCAFVDKTYAFVFQPGENATVAALLLRLQVRPEFSSSALTPTSVVTFDKDFEAAVEVDSVYELVHLSTYTVTYAVVNRCSQAHGLTNAPAAGSNNEVSHNS